MALVNWAHGTIGLNAQDDAFVVALVDPGRQAGFMRKARPAAVRGFLRWPVRHLARIDIEHRADGRALVVSVKGEGQRAFQGIRGPDVGAMVDLLDSLAPRIPVAEDGVAWTVAAAVAGPSVQPHQLAAPRPYTVLACPRCTAPLTAGLERCPFCSVPLH